MQSDFDAKFHSDFKFFSFKIFLIHVLTIKAKFHIHFFPIDSEEMFFFQNFDFCKMENEEKSCVFEEIKYWFVYVSCERLYDHDRIVDRRKYSR